MNDAEKGPEVPVQEPPKVSLRSKVAKAMTLHRIVIGVIFLALTVLVMFGIGIISTKYVNEDVDEPYAQTKVDADEHDARSVYGGLVRRHELVDDGAISVPISTQTALSTIYSVSRPPHVTTVVETVTGTTYYTVIDEPSPVVTVSVIATEISSSDICSVDVVTLTETVTFTPGQPQASTPGDATVTGNPATVTELQTELSITSGLPDATVSGNPGTVTDIQTDFSLSSRLPDATVSGNPGTVTNVQTDFSVSSGLPDATVPGHPVTLTQVHTSYSVSAGQSSQSIWTVVVITDLFPPASTTTSPEPESTTVAESQSTTVVESQLTTVVEPQLTTIVESQLVTVVEPQLTTVTQISTLLTTMSTRLSSVATLTVTVPYSPPPPPPAESSTSDAAGEAQTAASTSTWTEVVTETAAPSTSTTTVQVPALPPYPTANFTMGLSSSSVAGAAEGTATLGPVPTTTPPVVVVSGGPKKRGPTGTSNLGCVVMIVAALMILV